MNKKQIKFFLQASLVTYVPVLDKIITPFITQYPFWTAAWLSAIGLYSLYMYVEQDKLNEVILFIKNNPSKFSRSIVESEYFRTNFLKFLGEYLKQYNNSKREALKKILLDNLSDEDKRQFELDRFNNVINQISLDAMKNLLWINNEIVPLINADVEKELLQFDAKDQREINRLRYTTKTRKSVSTYVMNWIHQKYDPDSVEVKQQYKYDDTWGREKKLQFSQEHWLKKHEVEKIINDYWAEYTSLGIMISIAEGSSYNGGSGTVYKLTRFGEQFIKYIS